jgi:dienelactone hydrolase
VSKCILSLWMALVGVTIAAGPSDHSDTERGPRLDAFDVLLTQSAPGTPSHARTPAEWERRREEIIAGMVSVTGPLPGSNKAVPFEMRVEEETDCGSYLRQRISYLSEPGCRTPAYLCLPKSASPANPLPAVLCLHPTDDKVGNGVVVGLGGKKNRQYASELAQRNLITISPAYPHLADYRPDLKALGYVSGTMKAVWDNRRALDLLETLPQVQNGAFGAIGHSLGGHNAVFTAVFDSRIKVVVSSCGLDSFQDYKDGNLKGWTQDRYMPRMARYLGNPGQVPFDFPELLAALAPRHVFLSAPVGDSNFSWKSVQRVARAARHVYALHHSPHHLVVDHPEGGHDFPDAMRTKSYELLLQVLTQPR